jgi:NuA3 HAT complex component NTO1
MQPGGASRLLRNTLHSRRAVAL